jgi:hypothetical protein
MWGGTDHPVVLALVLGAVPVTIVAVAFVVVAMLALTARRTSTRRHCIEVLGALTGFIRAIRGAR